MRSIKRIHRICAKLEKLWKFHPDQRFGQLISNYIPINFWIEDEKEDWMSKDTKYIEQYIDKEIAECELFQRVMLETSYRKDIEKYWQDWKEWNRKYPLEWDMSDRKHKIRSKKEPKHPEWKDYVKDLK